MRIASGSGPTVTLSRVAGFSLLLFAWPACASLTVEDEAVRLAPEVCGGRAFDLEQLCDDEIALLERARQDPGTASGTAITRAALLDVGRREGLDYATAVYFHRVNGEAKTADYLKRIRRLRAGIEKSKSYPTFSHPEVSLAMVPAMYYNSNASIGGDGRDIRNMAARLGISSELVIVNPDGSVEENGRFLCDWLKERRSNGKKYLFASISKAALDIKRALQLCGGDGTFDHVFGWLNVGGVNRGSYLINEMDATWSYRWRARYYFWKEGYTYESFLSVKVDEAYPYHADAPIPAGLKVVNVIATPTQKHLTKRAEEAYKILSKYGPNDGLGMLADAYMPGAINVSLWGNDHYFAVPAEREVLLATALAELMESVPR